MGHLHIATPNETLLAVVVGAILATVGGLVGNWIESTAARRGRERSAAVLFGEILSALEALIDIAAQSRSRGDPYGLVTMRILSSVRREIMAYEHNRPTLYDLGNSELRVRIHVLIVRLTLAIEGIFEGSAALEAHRQLRTVSTSATSEVPGDVQNIYAQRDAAFDYAKEVCGSIPQLVQALQKLAKVKFDDLKRHAEFPVAETTTA